MTLRINNYDWKVIFVSEYDERLKSQDEDRIVLGRTHYCNLLIAINKDVAEEIQKDTIIHEITHAYLFSIGIGDDRIWNEEELCSFIGNNLLTILKLYEQVAGGKYDKD